MLAVLEDYMPPHITPPTAADIIRRLADAATKHNRSYAWRGCWLLRWRVVIRVSGEAYQHRRATMRHTTKTRSLFIIFPRGPTSSLFCLLLPISHGCTTPRVTLSLEGYDKPKLVTLFENIAGSWFVIIFNEWTYRPTQRQFSQATAADG